MTPAAAGGTATLVRSLPTLDAVLAAHAAALGDDFNGYRNHAYRVANLSIALSSCDADAVEKTALAAAFHDLGIWTDRTFDYLEPSVRLATAYLTERGRASWAPGIAAMIREHHKISRYRDDAFPLVEPFRRADLIDVSRGLVTFGLSRRTLASVLSAWPSAGFHKRLVRLELQRLRTHPWNPLPMLRL
jgi:hypothetical protein